MQSTFGLSIAPPRAACAARRPWQLGFWPAFVTTMRPYLACVSAAAGLVGLAIGGAASGVLGGALLVFFLVYGLGQAVTDVTQTDTDALSAPYRPLVRKIVRRGDVLAVALVGLVGCAAFLATLNRGILLLAALAVLGLLTYTPLKRRFWGGPIHNSWIVALLPAMGAMCGGAAIATTITTPRVLLAMASAFGSYAVFVVLGYFKDVEADRATGYDTLPVRLGRRAAIGVSALLGGAALIPSAVLVAPAFTGRFSWAVFGAPFWLAGLVLFVVAHVGMLDVRRDDDAHPWIVASVRSFVLLRLGEALVADPSLFHVAIGFVILMETTLATRPAQAQV